MTKRLNEGPFDFIRGAASETRSQVANSRVGQAVGGIVQAGRTASQTADLQKSVNALAQLLMQYEKMKGGSSPKPQRQEPTMPAQPLQAQRAPSPTQQATPPQSQPQQTNQYGGVASAFTSKPKLDKRGGFKMTFDSYLQAVHGEQLDEGVWDFVKGAGKDMWQRAAARADKFTQDSTLAQIYNAGAKASRESDARRAGEKHIREMNAVRAKTLQQLKDVTVRVKAMGERGQAALTQTMQQLPPEMQRRIMKLVANNIKHV